MFYDILESIIQCISQTNSVISPEREKNDKNITWPLNRLFNTLKGWKNLTSSSFSLKIALVAISVYNK